MKIRTGFVSNSSACSFVIKRPDVSDEKIERIKQYADCGALEKCREKSTRCPGCRDDFWEYNDQGWRIEVTKESVSCDTSIANFDLYSYITRVLEINPRDISVSWDEGISVLDYHSDRSFEEVRKEQEERMKKSAEIMAKLREDKKK
jgi:hypothetical protein